MPDPRAAILRARVHAAARLQAARTVMLAASSDDREIVEGVIGKGQEKLAALAAALIAGTLSRSAFVEQAQAVLTSTVARGAALGGAGRADAASIADDLLSARADYLSSFADELDAADGESGISEAQAGSRAGLWAGLAWTALNIARGQDARGDRDGANVSVSWVLDEAAQHCDDCPGLADGSPYTLDSLPTYPGDDVACGGNCRCSLSYETGDGSEE